IAPLRDEFRFASKGACLINVPAHFPRDSLNFLKEFELSHLIVDAACPAGCDVAGVDIVDVHTGRRLELVERPVVVPFGSILVAAHEVCRYCLLLGLFSRGEQRSSFLMRSTTDAAR